MMINSREALRKTIECDLKSMGMYPLSLRKKVGEVFAAQRWKLVIELRKLEYLKTKYHGGLIDTIILAVYSKRLERYQHKLGCEIPPGVFGPGLCINHTQGIVVTGNARVGANCRINAGVNIGEFGKFKQLQTTTNNYKQLQT